MKELKISDSGNLNLDIMELPESCVIILSRGKAKYAELPEHAETKIVTYKGRVSRVNWNIGENF